MHLGYFWEVFHNVDIKYLSSSLCSGKFSITFSSSTYFYPLQFLLRDVWKWRKQHPLLYLELASCVYDLDSQVNLRLNFDTWSTLQNIYHIINFDLSNWSWATPRYFKITLQGTLFKIDFDLFYLFVTD